MAEASRIVGLDIGEKKIGVAVSDPLLVLAHPLEVLVGYSPAQLADYIVELSERIGALEIVVGLPISQTGEEGNQAASVRGFIQPLLSRGLTVIFRDERLSTVEARRRIAESSPGKGGRRRRQQPDDAAAAAIVLQGYLDSLGPAQRDA